MALAASASSYPFLDVFWTILLFFLWVMWFWILISVFIDIFRSRDLSGLGKALWFLFVLRDRGVITPEEFDREKAKVLTSV